MEIVKAPDCPHYIFASQAAAGARTCRKCVFRPVRPADSYGVPTPRRPRAGERVDVAWAGLEEAA